MKQSAKFTFQVPIPSMGHSRPLLRVTLGIFDAILVANNVRKMLGVWEIHLQINYTDYATMWLVYFCFILFWQEAWVSWVTLKDFWCKLVQSNIIVSFYQNNKYLLFREIKYWLNRNFIEIYLVNLGSLKYLLHYWNRTTLKSAILCRIANNNFENIIVATFILELYTNPA